MFECKFFGKFRENNDEVKSLVRLLDKTRELNYREKDVKVLAESALADYVKDQRLTGAVIFNSRLEPVLYEAGDGLFPWQTVVQRVFVKNILTYPFKQFASREAFGDIGFYDYGVVARHNAKSSLFRGGFQSFRGNLHSNDPNGINFQNLWHSWFFTGYFYVQRRHETSPSGKHRLVHRLIGRSPS